MKTETKKRLYFVLLGVALFIISFLAGAASRMSSISIDKKFRVEWNDNVGRKITDLSYGKGSENKFDLYLPADNKRKAYGLVVYIHPGGFTSGDKADDKELLQWLCSKGYVAASINYTLATEKNPGANVYTQSMDIRRAMPVVVKEARKHGYNITEMAIGGGSAGGTLAMLYAYRDATTSPIPVKMLFECVGPSSFYSEDWTPYGTDKDPKAAAGLFSMLLGKKINPNLFGTAAYDSIMKPISAYMWVDSLSVPTVCAYGSYDKVCPFLSSRHLIKALKDNHVPFQYFEATHSGHGLQNDTDVYAAYMQTVSDWLDKYLPIQ
jgi:acetyl esterase/lipase